MVKFEVLENSLRYMKRMFILYNREKNDTRKKECLACYQYACDEFLKRSYEYYGPGFGIKEYINMVIEEGKKGRVQDEFYQRNR